MQNNSLVQTSLEGHRPTDAPAPDAQASFEEESTLQLSYKNETGNAIVVREYINHEAFVREVDEEWMYNYAEERWERVNRFVHDWELADDGETLKGDGSNWRGTGRNWQNWFTQRHYERLQIRFPGDEIPESPDDHDPIGRPDH